MEPLNEELGSFLKSQGASLVGFADLSEIDSDSRDGFPFGISIAAALNPQIVSEITGGPTMRYVEEYKRANLLLKDIGQSLEHFLWGKGYGAKAITPTTYQRLDNHATRLPHKTAATRAGLGWIGKCAMLVTREYGSAIRLANVLTDAPLSCGKPINTSFCGGCAECVKICPDAVSGRNWQVGVSRESFFDASACYRTARERARKLLGEKGMGCGRCMVVCPWTQKYIAKAV
jgi:epoxyqueuosine reductase QueG